MGTWTFPMKATSYPVCGRRHQEAQWQLNHDFLDPTPTLPNPSKPWSKPYIGFTARVERAMVARSNKRNDAHELSISLEEKFSDLPMAGNVLHFRQNIHNTTMCKPTKGLDKSRL